MEVTTKCTFCCAELEFEGSDLEARVQRDSFGIVFKCPLCLQKNSIAIDPPVA
jgi:hypothetical protein